MKKLYIFAILIVFLFAGCKNSAEPPDVSPDAVSPSVTAQDVTSDITPDVPDVAETVSPDTETSAPDADFDAEAFIDELFAAVKANDISGVDKHMSYAELTGFSGEELKPDSEQQKLAAEVFRRLSWSVTGGGASGASMYNITCDITNVDMVSAVSQFLVDSNRLVSENEGLPDGERLSEEQIDERLMGMLITSIKAENAVVTHAVEIRAALVDGEWRITADEALSEALTGDFQEAVRQSGFTIYN